MFAVMLIAQTVATLATPGDTGIATGKVELVEPCRAGSGEIVVCGRGEAETFRPRPLDSQRFEPKPLRATIGLGPGTLGVEGDQQAFGNGAISKAIKLKFKMTF